jgi:hypothetical protein
MESQPKKAEATSTSYAMSKAGRVMTKEVVNYMSRRARVGQLSQDGRKRMVAAFLAINADAVERANIFTRARTGKKMHYKIKLIDTNNALSHMDIAGPLVLLKGRRAHSDQFIAVHERPAKEPKKKKKEEEEEEQKEEEPAAAAAEEPKKKKKSKDSSKKKKKNKD